MLGGEPDSATVFQLSLCAIRVSQTHLFPCCWAAELVWSEPDSVAYTESLSYVVDHCAVYILWRSGSVPVLSLGRFVDPADSSRSPGEAGPVREFSRISSGERAGC